MRLISSIIMSALLFTGCTWEAGGVLKPGYSSGGHSGTHVVDSGYSPSGYGAPIVVDAHTECWLDPYSGQYVWYHESVVDHSSGYIDMIDEIWIDIYDNYGLAASFPLRDDVWYQEWAWPSWVDPYYGLDTPAFDGLWMYASMEADPFHRNLRCGSKMPYEVYTTVYDIDGGYVTAVNYL